MFLLKGTLATILFFVIFILIVLAIVFHNAIRNLRIFRSSAEKAAERAARKAAAEEEYFRRTSTKNYRSDDKPKFSEDYFKGTPGKQNAAATSQNQQRQQQEQPQPRRTTTDDGVTIIDQRQEAPATDRKIFDNEGEYVEFEEV